jgi:hypothetical protein
LKSKFSWSEKMSEYCRKEKREEMAVRLQAHWIGEGKSSCRKSDKTIINNIFLIVNIVCQNETFQSKSGDLTDQIYAESYDLVQTIIFDPQFRTLQRILRSNPDDYLDWSNYRIQHFITGHSFVCLKGYHHPKNKMNTALKTALNDIARNGSFKVILSLIMTDIGYVYQQGIAEMQSAKVKYDQGRNQGRRDKIISSDDISIEDVTLIANDILIADNDAIQEL